MNERPAINHLERLGLERNPDYKSDIPTIDILGRRSRKQWYCEAGEKCSIGYLIDIDEVYVEHTLGKSRYSGEHLRYHVACAINAQVVRPVQNAIDKNNSRRQAIQEQRARRKANVG